MQTGKIFEKEAINFLEDFLKDRLKSSSEDSLEIKIQKEYKNEKINNYIADFFFKFKNINYIGEIKYYRSPLAQMELLTRAAFQITEAAKALNKNIKEQKKEIKEHTIPVLIVSCYVSPTQRKILSESHPSLILIDRSDLLGTTFKSGKYFKSSILLDSDDLVTYSDSKENNLNNRLFKDCLNV